MEIKNVLVPGYAKDHLDDVHDSAFIDNHAWNAVKLDGLWYLYDVTWSTGIPTFTMNRFNRWKSKLQRNFQIKYKQKKIRRQRRSWSDDCGREYRIPAYFYKQKFTNKLLAFFVY